MRIVHLVTTLGVGGAEKHLLWLTEGQRERGHEVRVLYLKGEGELREAFEAQGVPVDVVPMERAAAAPRALLALAARLRALGPDLVHTHLLKADMLGAVAARLAGVPAVVASKHNDERPLLCWPAGLVHGLVTTLVDRVVVLSDHVGRFVGRHGRVPARKIRRVYYGVDPERLQPARPRASVRAELGLREDHKVLVCVARFAPQKDHPTLLRAVAQLADEDVVLLLVGGDPFGDGEARARALAEQLGIAGQVRFCGIRDDVPDLLGASDVFVMASSWEGLGLVFLEAMAVGLPIVATRVSAVPEVVVEDETGWLVTPRNYIAMAAALRMVFVYPREAARRGPAGRARLEQVFGLPRMIDEIEAVYAEARA